LEDARQIGTKEMNQQENLQMKSSKDIRLEKAIAIASVVNQSMIIRR
jgi:hypothetical protein